MNAKTHTAKSHKTCKHKVITKNFSGILLCHLTTLIPLIRGIFNNKLVSIWMVFTVIFKRDSVFISAYWGNLI